MSPNPAPFNPNALLGLLAGLFSNNAGGATGALGAGLGALGGYPQQPTGTLGVGLGTLGATPRAIPGVATRTTQSASTPFPGYLSPQQQLDLAKQEALAQLKPILDEYHYQQDQARQYAQAQAEVARARGEALAKIYAGIAPQVQQNYQQAADSTAGYAKGYSTDLQNTVNQDTAANNAELDKVAPGIGQRQTPANVGDVLFGTMGKIPADTLQAQGAAFKSAADFLPGTARGQGEQDALTALNQGYLQNQGLQHQIDTYLAQTPGLTSSALAQLQKDQQALYNSDQTAKYRQAQLQIGADRNATQAKLGQQRLAVDAAAKAAAVKQRQQQINLDAQARRIQAQQKQQDAADLRAYRQGRLTLDQYNLRVKERALAVNEKIANATLGLKAQNQTFQQKAQQVKLTQAQQRLAQGDRRLALQSADAQARIKLAQGNQQISLKRLLVQEKQFEARAATDQQKQAWQAASNDAAAKTQSGLIYHVVPDKNGNPVVEPWIVNGKAQITASLRKQMQGGGSRPLSAKDRINQNSAAEKGARLAFQGGTLDEKTPSFQISKTDPGTGQGWSEPIVGADGKLIGYRNHYPPTDFATAFQDAVEHGVDPQIATQHLIKWFTGHPDRGGPMTKVQRAQAKQLRGQLKRAGIKPSQYVPNSQLPRAEPGR